MNRNILRFSAAFFILQAFFVFSRAETIVIYHTSDVHGSYSSRPASWNRKNPSRRIGGFAALSALVKKEKKPYMLLDSGDWFQGTPEGNFTKGVASVALMNKLGYKASAVGNHDYDYGEENLKSLVSSAKFAFLGANIYRKDTGVRVDYIKPYAIFEVGGKKIGVLGISNSDTVHTSVPTYVRHLAFGNEEEETARWVPEIKRKGADAVIVLAHAGMGGKFAPRRISLSGWVPGKNDAARGTVAIARSVPGIAAVLGGHRHSGTVEGYHDRKSATLLVESYSGLSAVSRVELEFDDETGRFTGAESRLVDLWVDETGEDKEVLETLKPFSDKLRAKMGRVVGETEVDLLRNSGDADSVIGNWVTDVMRKAGAADVAFENTYGIRADILKGKITFSQLYHALPFDDPTLVTLELSGKQLVELMRQNLSGGKSMMQVSGVKVRYNTAKDGRVKDVRLFAGGKPVGEKDVLRVATDSYLVTGGTGGRVFAEGKKINDTLVPIRDVVEKELEKSFPVRMPEGGRIIRERGRR